MEAMEVDPPNTRTLPFEVTSPTIPDHEVLVYRAPRQLTCRRTTEECLERASHNAYPEDEDCTICLEPLGKTEPVSRLKQCGHFFHDACIRRGVSTLGLTICPNCRVPLKGNPQGKCPSGTLTIQRQAGLLCGGFTNSTTHSFVLQYHLPSGRQASYHESPGDRYSGTNRVAYVPDNADGRRLVSRLKYAWNHGLTFTIGTSMTTNASNVIVWSSIHHKTSYHGGPYGFPDESYFWNVNEELDNLGVPAWQDC